jgi:hypothetical protein
MNNYKIQLPDFDSKKAFELCKYCWENNINFRPLNGFLYVDTTLEGVTNLKEKFDWLGEIVKLEYFEIMQLNIVDE